MTIATDLALEFKLEDMVRKMVEFGASDLHLGVGSAPAIRVDGKLHPLQDFPVLTQDMMERVLFPELTPDQNHKLLQNRELDFSYSVPGLSRFRGNILWQRGTLGAVFRAIPSRPVTLEELKTPPVVAELANRPRGLVLVTGPTGSGKSTTLAGMIDYINSNFDHHIVTVEDPIEFLHKNKRCIVRQRELGSDTLSFAAALKHVLRQDPDVILVGEMRDLETISLAVTAAETGHLVFGTLHTTSAATTIDRMIDVFPAGQQAQIRMQLSSTLQGVISQTLIPHAGGRGRVCAMEIMVGTPAVRNLIREGKTHQIPNMLASGANVGMQTLNQTLKLLVQEGQITVEAALEKSNAPDELQQFLGRW
ncbi:MAG: type IV pilus twitching motility protein PilT [Armatimonadetes bacterium]|nr:type IV pilus twitching motility protein PilT [Armatimonadota bacterium]